MSVRYVGSLATTGKLVRVNNCTSIGAGTSASGKPRLLPLAKFCKVAIFSNQGGPTVLEPSVRVVELLAWVATTTPTTTPATTTDPATTIATVLLMPRIPWVAAVEAVLPPADADVAELSAVMTLL